MFGWIIKKILGRKWLDWVFCLSVEIKKEERKEMNNDLAVMFVLKNYAVSSYCNSMVKICQYSI